MPAERWTDLLSISAAVGMRLWLVVHAAVPTTGQTAALAGSTWKRVTLGDFDRQWPEPSNRSPGPEPSPMLPAETFLIFRAACRWTLTAEQFERVDATYLRCLDETAKWLTDWPESIALSRPAVHAFLQRLTADCDDAADALVRFRAAQAQLFRHGWLLLVDGQETAVVDPADSLTRLNRARTARLRALADPRATALAVASLVSETPLDTIVAMKVGHTGPRHLDINAHRYGVPPWACGLVAALVQPRHQTRARAGSRLFVDRAGLAPMDLREAHGLLDHVSERTGIRFRTPPPSIYKSKTTPPDLWLSLDALRLVEIGEPPRQVAPWFG